MVEFKASIITLPSHSSYKAKFRPRFI
ncbi:uncharacterized protein FFMR_10761 [Fusarium fujikuroi]|nr:uncharacterized protein FFMR_10761 [Fusarium fujikuroi]